MDGAPVLRHLVFKVGLSPCKKIVLFASVKALKMLKNTFHFIFLFSRYSPFCLDSLVM